MSEDSFHSSFLGHPTGVTFNIVGIECGNQGQSCDEHEDACVIAVLKEDAVVRICKVQVVVNGKEESALAAYLISDGIDCCQVGFLRRHLLQKSDEYHGRIGQITNMCGHSDSPTMKKKNKQNWGCCEAVLINSVMCKKPAVIGPLIAAGTAPSKTSQEQPPRKKKRQEDNNRLNT